MSKKDKKDFKIEFSYGCEIITLEWKDFPYSFESFMDFLQRFLSMTGFSQKEIDTYISQWGEDIVRKYEKENQTDE